MKKIRRISLLVLTLIATGAITTAFVDYNKESNTSINKQMIHNGEEGKVVKLFPPSNDGSSHGVAIIEGLFGGRHVAQTPEDNNGSLLFEGQAVVFTTDARGEIESVKGKKGNVK